MSKFVTIIAVSECKQDKNGRNYQLITVESPNKREMVDEETGEIFMVLGRPKRTRVIAYEKSYLDDTPHYLFDKEPGQRVYGTIVTRKVAPYTIEGDTESIEVSTYTTFVEATQEDENYNEIVEAAFKSAGHPLVIIASNPQKAQENAPVEESGTNEQETAEDDSQEDDGIPEGAFSITGDDLEDEF